MSARSFRARFVFPALFNWIWIGPGFCVARIERNGMGAARGGFRYYDPPLMKIYGIGILLSLSGLLAGLGGVWKKNPLRWHAPVLSLGMLLLWVLWASSE